jgi:hypothetical protein
MPKFRAGKGADAAGLRRELADVPGATAKEDAGGVTVEVPDVRHVARAEMLTRGHAGRALIQRVRQAKPGSAELRDAIADVLEAMLS